MNVFQNLTALPDRTFWCRRLFGIVIMIAIIPTLNGCTGAVVGAGAAAGVAAFENAQSAPSLMMQKSRRSIDNNDRGPDAFKIGIEVFEVAFF